MGSAPRRGPAPDPGSCGGLRRPAGTSGPSEGRGRGRRPDLPSELEREPRAAMPCVARGRCRCAARSPSRSLRAAASASASRRPSLPRGGRGGALPAVGGAPGSGSGGPLRRRSAAARAAGAGPGPSSHGPSGPSRGLRAEAGSLARRSILVRDKRGRARRGLPGGGRPPAPCPVGRSRAAPSLRREPPRGRSRETWVRAAFPGGPPARAWDGLRFLFSAP